MERRERILIERLAGARDLDLPQRASAGASGFDLRAALDETLRLEPGSRARVPCGVRLQMPSGWEAQVRPRSGLAARHGLTVLNAPGTIDSDYRGEVSVLLINLGDAVVELERGDRIAQMVFARVGEVALEEVETVDDSERGSGGFGSTGRT